MNGTRLRASLAVCLAAGAFVATSWPEAVVWGAEQQRQRPGQVTPPRDAVPRAQPAQLGLRVRLTADRAERFADASLRGLDYVPGEVVVRFRSFTTPAARQRALDALRGRPNLRDIEWHGPVAIVRDPTQPDAHVLADELSRQPEVEYAEPNHIVRIGPGLDQRTIRPEPAGERLTPPPLTPNDEDYAAYQWNFTMLDMPGAWEIQPGGGSDLIVAVLDTGVTSVNQSLSFRVWTGSAFEDVPMSFAVNPDLPASRLTDPRDFIFLDPAGPVLDMDGHGSHVSGTIAQETNNGLLLAGLAYNTRIMPVKVCVGYWELMIARAQANLTGFLDPDAGGCATVDLADGIRYAADRGARVLNMSLAGSSPMPTVLDAINYAVSRGAFVAISMGNDYEDGNPVMYPARYAQDIMGVMSVGAVGKQQARAFYSSTGAHNEIAAPGGDSRVTLGTPDAGRVWQSAGYFPDFDPRFIRRPNFDRYDGIGSQGTSMAAPHVAGLAALIAAQSPGITPANIERAIRATARDLGAPGKDNDYGYGLIQPRSVLFGWGLRK